jgi:hypothetical protein
MMIVGTCLWPPVGCSSKTNNVMLEILSDEENKPLYVPSANEHYLCSAACYSGPWWPSVRSLCICDIQCKGEAEVIVCRFI